MTHHRPDYYASARMHSTRIANTDGPANSEGLLSHHLADGCFVLMRSGREYRDIYGVWDWQKIPGTTVRQEPELKGSPRRMGTTDFVGGVSDGDYGLAACDFERNGLTAKKSWFFFDEGVVCLGAGISAAPGGAVVTTLNQCNLDGDVLLTKAWETDNPRPWRARFQRRRLALARPGRLRLPRTGNASYSKRRSIRQLACEQPPLFRTPRDARPLHCLDRTRHRPSSGHLRLSRCPRNRPRRRRGLSSQGRCSCVGERRTASGGGPRASRSRRRGLLLAGRDPGPAGTRDTSRQGVPLACANTRRRGLAYPGKSDQHGERRPGDRIDRPNGTDLAPDRHQLA